jgi:hypothetical protein
MEEARRDKLNEHREEFFFDLISRKQCMQPIPDETVC